MTSLPSFFASSITEASAALAQCAPGVAMAAAQTSAAASWRRCDSIIWTPRVGPSGGDLPRHRTIAEGGGHEQRVNASATCDKNVYVAGLVGNADVIRVADLGEPAGATVLQALDRAFDEAGEGNAGALEHRLL